MQASKEPCAGINRDIEGGMSAAGCIQQATFERARAAGRDASLDDD